MFFVSIGFDSFNCIEDSEFVTSFRSWLVIVSLVVGESIDSVDGGVRDVYCEYGLSETDFRCFGKSSSVPFP